jgi:hypothetical protein
MTAYLAREIAPRLERALRQFPVVVLSGLRQSGKSTLLQNEPDIARGRTYRTLGDFVKLRDGSLVMKGRVFSNALRRVDIKTMELDNFWHD